jgi:hypothetical protein
MSANVHWLVSSLPISDPDEALTSALERVRHEYGDDIGAFFNKLYNKKQNQPTLFDLEEAESTLPLAALTRCVKK